MIVKVLRGVCVSGEVQEAPNQGQSRSQPGNGTAECPQRLPGHQSMAN